MDSDRPTPPPTGMVDRREAIRRVALLLGGALSAPAIAGVLAGVSACGESGRAPAQPWVPRALTPPQGELVAAVAEHIVPETDTPGARAARVHEFIDTMLADYYDDAERARFREGLADLDRRASDAHAVAFLRCSGPQQRALLVTLDRETYAAPSGASFFRRMKELTLLGYYTSEPGATQELRYEQVPGRFEGCVPFSDIGRAWAT